MKLTNWDITYKLKLWFMICISNNKSKFWIHPYIYWKKTFLQYYCRYRKPFTIYTVSFTMKSKMLFGCDDGLQFIVTTAALLVAACWESAQLIKYMKAQIKMCPCFWSRMFLVATNNSLKLQIPLNVMVVASSWSL